MANLPQRDADGIRGGCGAPRERDATLQDLTWCRVTSWHDHAGAAPLRNGELYCAKHADQAGSVPDGAVCATCHATRSLSKDPSDATDPARNRA